MLGRAIQVLKSSLRIPHKRSGIMKEMFEKQRISFFENYSILRENYINSIFPSR